MSRVILKFFSQNATSFLVKASTPIDLPAFSNDDISCVYQINVSTSTCRVSFSALQLILLYGCTTIITFHWTKISPSPATSTCMREILCGINFTYAHKVAIGSM